MVEGSRGSDALAADARLVGRSVAGGAAHVFVDDLDRPQLAVEDRHHLQRVLRLRAGQTVTVSDGGGGWRSCRYTGTPRLEPIGSIGHCPPAGPPITIGFALTKGDRPEWTVQRLTEAGVDRMVPVLTRRTIVHWDGERAVRQVARLGAVARAAAMQSRQVWLPTISEVQTFGALVAELRAAGGGALAQLDGGPPDLSRPTVLVGPEGGWDDDELACGLPTVGLGPTVLRAETAGLAAGLLLCALRAGTVRPAGRPGTGARAGAR